MPRAAGRRKRAAKDSAKEEDAMMTESGVDYERKRLREGCSESVGPAEKCVKVQKCRATSPCSESSSGRVTTTPENSLQKEIIRLQKKLEREIQTSSYLRKELGRISGLWIKKAENSESKETASGNSMRKSPSLSTLQDLFLKEKSMNVLKEGVTIVDCNLPDSPIIYANEGFV